MVQIYLVTGFDALECLQSAFFCMRVVILVFDDFLYTVKGSLGIGGRDTCHCIFFASAYGGYYLVGLCIVGIW